MLILELSFSTNGSLPEKDSMPLRFSFRVSNIGNIIRSINYQAIKDRDSGTYAVNQGRIISVANEPVSEVNF